MKNKKIIGKISLGPLAAFSPLSNIYINNLHINLSSFTPKTMGTHKRARSSIKLNTPSLLTGYTQKNKRIKKWRALLAATVVDVTDRRGEHRSPAGGRAIKTAGTEEKILCACNFLFAG